VHAFIVERPGQNALGLEKLVRAEALGEKEIAERELKEAGDVLVALPSEADTKSQEDAVYAVDDGVLKERNEHMGARFSSRGRGEFRFLFIDDRTHLKALPKQSTMALVDAQRRSDISAY
jgi:hypothetical protein